MKKPLIAILVLLSSGLRAQDAPPKKYINHHRFELAFSGGYALNTKISQKREESYKWTIYNSPVYSISLGYYITKRISAGARINAYRWNANRYSLDNKHINNALSTSIFADYNLPVRSSIFYAGISAGAAKSDVIGNEHGNLGEGKGYELNAHVGYKLTLVRNRFWLGVEAGATDAVIGKEYGYTISSYPITASLMFRI